ncbi:MAG: hypothetical protein RIC30_03830 [Marinoscillum sp.]|uniref:arsenate reductase family protein n=1 Tax=Marinoscillum sp. TaxID=2024838 RepID=UPI0032F7D6C3
MEIAENELLFIYDSNDLQDREALAYAQSLKNYQVKTLDVRAHTFTEWQLQEILERLEVEPEDLINRRSAVYLKEYVGVELDREDTLKAIRKHTDLIKTPVVIYHDSARLIGSSYELIKKDMS